MDAYDSRGLDLSGRDGGFLVVGSEFGGLSGNTLEDIVDERVQDRHGTVGDTSVRVDLLEDCIQNASALIQHENLDPKFGFTSK